MECKITIKGTQKSFENDSAEVISYDSTGTFRLSEKDLIKYVTYVEYDEERPDVSRKVFLKIEKNTVTMQKQGTETKLIMEKDKRHECIYATDFGPLSFGIYTETVDDNLNENGGELHLAYTLSLNGSLASINTLDLKIEPLNSNLN